MPPIEVGNDFYDQIAGRHFEVTANGTLDAPPTITCDIPMLILHPSADGLSCDIDAPGIDIPSYNLTFQAPADNPSTPDLESVSLTFHGAFSHSKATELAGASSVIPLPAVP